MKIDTHPWLWGKALLLALLASPPAHGQTLAGFEARYNACKASIIANRDYGSIRDQCDGALKEAYKFGNQSGQVGDVATLIGAYFTKTENYAEAEKFYLNALRIRQINVNNCSNCAELLTDTQHNLAGLYAQMGQFQKAEPLFLKALGIKEQILDKGHPSVARTKTDLGAMYVQLNRIDEALKLYASAAVIQEAKERNSLNLAFTYHSLGELHGRKGDIANAERYLSRAIDLKSRLLEPKHPEVANSLNTLGVVYANGTQFEKAEKEHLKALEVRKASLPENHPDIGQSQVNLGVAYLGQKKYGEAERHLRDGLKKREAHFGEKSGPVAYALEQLAKVLRATNRTKEAAELEKRAASIRAA